jgi:hypothetical protein
MAIDFNHEIKKLANSLERYGQVGTMVISTAGNDTALHIDVHFEKREEG